MLCHTESWQGSEEEWTTNIWIWREATSLNVILVAYKGWKGADKPCQILQFLQQLVLLSFTRSLIFVFSSLSHPSFLPGKPSTPTFLY
jgi:hypothetical protein